MSGFEATNFASEKVIKTGENSYFVQHGTDRNLIVEFYTDAAYHEFESTQKGHAVYKDVDMIRIRTPGLNGNTIERKVKLVSDGSSPSDPDRFPAQWRAYQQQQEQKPDGFPIEQWPVLKKSHVLNLKAQGIHVLEQVIALPDGSLGILGLDGRRLRDMAKSYLDTSKNQAQLSVALAERDQMRADLQALKETVASLKDADTAKLATELAAARQEIEKLKAAPAQAPKKKRGRPSLKDKEQTTDGH